MPKSLIVVFPTNKLSIDSKQVLKFVVSNGTNWDPY